MDLDSLTLGQLKDLKSLFGNSSCIVDHPYKVGQNYFIRTVTYHYTGKLIKVTKQELVLADAAWVADEGRFSEAMRKGILDEVEPYLDGVEVIIGRGSIIDACIWGYKLPREVK